jgi:hypothetical protein
MLKMPNKITLIYDCFFPFLRKCFFFGFARFFRATLPWAKPLKSEKLPKFKKPTVLSMQYFAFKRNKIKLVRFLYNSWFYDYN